MRKYFEWLLGSSQNEKKDKEAIFSLLKSRHDHIAEAVNNWANPQFEATSPSGKPIEDKCPLNCSALAALHARVRSHDELGAILGTFLDGKIDDLAKAVRYRLVIADVFVEKAQEALTDRAKFYKNLGISMYFVALGILTAGTWFAYQRLNEYDGPFFKSGIPENSILSLAWLDLVSRFVLAFTLYGFVAIVAVALTRGAKACLDQQEQLLAKRHSLRQGRLYLHLTGGNVNIEEMERAFNWNHSQENAFGHLPTDIKAPWGKVFEELVKTIPELVKTGVAAAQAHAQPQSTNIPSPANNRAGDPSNKR